MHKPRPLQHPITSGAMASMVLSLMATAVLATSLDSSSRAAAKNETSTTNVQVDVPEAIPTPSITALSTTQPARLASLSASIDGYIASRQGNTSFAALDLDSQLLLSAGEERRIFETASVIKLTLLEMLLLRAQDESRALTLSERSLATHMIATSDNASTEILWTRLGGPQALRRFLDRIGATDTTTNASWGLTATSAVDQLKVLQVVSDDNTILNNASRSEARSYLAKVISAQRWGVSAGVDGDPLLKNGWLPRSSGWVVNSVGIVEGRYLIAVMTHENASQTYGIETIEHISAMVASEL